MPTKILKPFTTIRHRYSALTARVFVHVKQLLHFLNDPKKLGYTIQASFRQKACQQARPRISEGSFEAFGLVDLWSTIRMPGIQSSRSTM